MLRFFVLCIMVAQTASAQVPGTNFPKDVVAVSKNGECRLQLRTASLRPFGDKGAEASLYFDLEFADPKTGEFLLGYVPPDTYLENENPLIRAQIAAGRELSARKNRGWTDSSGRSVALYLSDLDEHDANLQSLNLAVTLVRVKSWDVMKFADLGRKESDYLDCGPFQLKVRGEENRVNVSVASFGDFKPKPGEERKEVPLRFVRHRFGFSHTTIYDAKARELWSGGYVGSGGMTGGAFVVTPEDPTKPDGGPISYPVRIEVRLPKDYDTERVEFEFTDIPLPDLNKTYDVRVRPKVTPKPQFQ